MGDITANLPSLSAGNRARDAEGVLSDVEMLIRAITPEWTDLSDADPGVALAQVFAYLSDHSLYQVERGLLDATLLRGSRRSSAIFLARALGYQVDGPTAAKATLRFTLTGGAQVVDVTIPKNFQCQGTHAGVTVVMETDENLTIPAGSTIGDVQASEGTGAASTLGTSNGQPFQQYKLAVASVVHNRTHKPTTVKVGGTTWTEVSSFKSSTLVDQHYMVIRDHLDHLTFVFGDGRKGQVPASGLSVVVEYRTGGGRSGNVPAGTITSVNDVLMVAGAPVAVAVTNTTAGTGGQPRETLESVQRSAPAFFAAQDRAVTSADYGTIVGAVSGVLRALGTRTYVNVVEVRVVPLGWDGAAISAALKLAVEAEIADKSMVTDDHYVLTAHPVRPRTSITVTAKDGHRRDAVKAAVKAKLEALYALATLNFGGTTAKPENLWLSDTIGAVENSDGVDHVDVAMFTRRSLLLGTRTGGWDMAAGNATFGSASVGAGATDETWTITFTSATAFKVKGSVSGHQLNVGSVDSQYTSDAGQVSFTVTAGATAMAAGNIGRFKTSRLVGNIPYLSTEHPVFVPAEDLTITMAGGI